jgi:ATP-dependent protease ClpP protease subunit
MITYELPDGQLPQGIMTYITPTAVSEDSTRSFKLDLIKWHNDPASKGNPILIDICSNGGNINDEISLRNTIQLLQAFGHKVIGRVSGRAWSCASWLLQCCDYRIVANGASLMFHEPRWTFEGTLSQHRQYLRESEDLLEQTIGFLLTHTGDKLDRAEVLRHIGVGNWYISGPEAVRLGLADKAE